ncbi:MAG: MFS transporter, partial [Gammaproteobacteria bacterium]|nr:MFS transporter [Gammaproteobacteria bacterium]
NLMQRRKPAMFFGTALSCLCISVVIYSSNMPYTLLAVLLFLFGFGMGAFMLSFTVGREINSLALTATVIALLNTGDAFLDSVTEPLLGSLLDWHWNGVMVNGVRYFSVSDYHLALGLLPMYSLVAFLLLFWVKETRCQQNG